MNEKIEIIGVILYLSLICLTILISMSTPWFIFLIVGTGLIGYFLLKTMISNQIMEVYLRRYQND